MTTFTGSIQFSSPPKSVHTGLVAVHSRTSICATGTASSVILLGNVPNNATLVDWWARVATAGTAQTVKIGTSNTPSGIAAAFSLTLTISASTQNYLLAGIMNLNAYRAPIGGDRLPVRISLSDDVQPAQVMLRAEFGTAISASAIFTFVLFYTMDGLTPNTTIR